MPRFKHYNYDQDAMVVINYQEQLQPGTFEHGVHYLIEHKLDLSVSPPRYRNEDTGRLAYALAILLKGLNRFSLRGNKRKVQGQWQLYCLVHNVHNIEKLANYGQMAA